MHDFLTMHLKDNIIFYNFDYKHFNAKTNYSVSTCSQSYTYLLKSQIYHFFDDSLFSDGKKLLYA